MTARLPKPGGDDGSWGDILNGFLNQSHNADGSIKNNVVTSAALAGNIPQTKITNLQTDIASKLNIDQTTPQTIINGQPIQDSLTASQLVSTDVNKKLQTLAVETYPSLTELSYVKGLTSGAQAQMASIAKLAPEPNGTDDTTNIQTLLDIGGTIKITKPGIYIVGKLTIGDNTLLELGKGVTFKKKNGTNQHILVNKGHITSTRNKNIWIKGGTWDMNVANNLSSGGNLSVDAQSWSGCGILINGVDGLKITDVEQIGNESKYCYLIANCINVICDNINFNNSSDGLHFQPPMYNVKVSNITGTTGDDMVSFTAGDYPKYTIGAIGNFENIIVENIYSTNTNEHIKLVGCGLDGNSIFKNFRISNISGTVRNNSVCVLYSDQSVANPYLLSTTVQNMVVENINPIFTVADKNYVMFCAKGDITIRNCYIKDQAFLHRFLLVGNGSGIPDNIIIENVYARMTTDTLDYFVICDTGTLLKNLVLNNVNINNMAMGAGRVMIYAVTTIDNICINNCKINVTGQFLGLVSTRTTDAFISINNCVISALYCLGIYTLAKIYISNSQLVGTGKIIYTGANTDLKLNVTNSNIPTITTNTLSGAKLSLNGRGLIWNNLLSQLTPQSGDIVKCTFASEPLGVGLMYYNGTTWSKFLS